MPREGGDQENVRRAVAGDLVADPAVSDLGESDRRSNCQRLLEPAGVEALGDALAERRDELEQPAVGRLGGVLGGTD